MCSTKGYDICLHCDEPLAIEKGPAVKYGSNSYDMPSRIRRHMNKPELTEGSDYVTYYNVNVQDPYTGGGAVAARCCESCSSTNGIRFCPMCEQSYVASREWYGHMADASGHVRRARSIVVCPDCSTSPDYPECVCSHPDCNTKINIKHQNGDPYSSGYTIGAMADETKVMCSDCKHHQYVCESSWCSRRMLDANASIMNDYDDDPRYFCSQACGTLSLSKPRTMRYPNPKFWPYVDGCGCRVCAWFSGHREEVEIMGWASPTPIDHNEEPCDGCGCTSPTVEPVSQGDDALDMLYVCHICAMGNTFECPSCGVLQGTEAYTSISESQVLNHMDSEERSSIELLCDNCLENSPLVWLCDVSCNSWYSTSSNECSCGGIHPWNYTPSSFKFFDCNEDHTKVPFLGIEIEVEAMKNRASRNSGAQLTRSIAKDWSWCMHDGSLGDNGAMGFEIVTHPMTYSWFTENWASIKDLLTQLTTHGMRSWDSGMHIHITRTNMSDAHQMRFLNFIYGSANLAMSIGGRRYTDPAMQRYAPFDAERRSDFLRYKVRLQSNPGVDGHYAAVNATKTNTLEARWMRGTLSPMSFRKNVEFIQSVWDFTRKFGHTSANEMNYITWLRGVPESKRFPNVLHHIEHNYITRR